MMEQQGEQMTRRDVGNDPEDQRVAALEDVAMDVRRAIAVARVCGEQSLARDLECIDVSIQEMQTDHRRSSLQRAPVPPPHAASDRDAG